ncbi:2' O-ribose methyltransferase [Orbilia ellipsospora]|uniref:rRNA methyltransferase 2, mitochondrial n=1 Tax=Orbilia ellipsospora TaxID=2528407 RepID=A0AAV9XLJ4_9PEZI
MTIPRGYFRILSSLALDLTPITQNTLRRTPNRIPLSSSCVFQQRQYAQRCAPVRSFSTTSVRLGSKKSSKLWLRRQMGDMESREAKVHMYKSRAAFKLIQIDQEHKIFRPGMTVVDLGYAPGSWSQVAVAQTTPNGRVIGIDLIPAPPPKGASAIQGNFLNPTIQASLRRYLADPNRGRPKPKQSFTASDVYDPPPPLLIDHNNPTLEKERIDTNPILELDNTTASGYIAQERRDSLKETAEEEKEDKEEKEANTVDVVLSDMLMNTSGIATRDHTVSMNLCNAALLFCIDVLKPGGSFVCKFYQGAEDKAFMKNVERVFNHAKKFKPDSSRPDSKECFIVAKDKKKGMTREDFKGAAFTNLENVDGFGWNIVDD